MLNQASSLKPSPAALVGAFAAIYLCWGATFLAIRWSVAEIPPLLTIAIRCAGGAALFLGWLALRGNSVRASAREWATAGVAGTLLFVGGHGLLAWGEQRIASGEAALFMTAIPLWLVLLDSLWRRRSPPLRVLLGLAGGVAGVAVLSTAAGEWSGRSVDRLALLVSAACWAVGSLVGRHGPWPASAAQTTGMQLFAGALGTVLVSLALGEAEGWQVAAVSPRAIGAMSFLILGGTVLGFGAYTWLLRVTTPAAVGTYAFVNPLIALFLAWLAGDGEFTVRTLVAAVLVLGAVILSHAPRFSGPPRQARGHELKVQSLRGSPAALTCPAE